MHLLSFLLAFASGSVLPVQAGANAELGRQLGHPVWGAVANFAVGLLALLLVAAVAARAMPAFPKPGVPWWAWTGGLCGAAYIAMALHVAPRVGVVNLTLYVLAGQMVGSLVVDHFGLAGLAERAITPQRVGGVLLVIAGVLLARWPGRGA